MNETLTALAATALAVATFLAAAVALVGFLTWALFAIPGSPWPRLCKSDAVGAQVLTTLVALAAYLAIPGWLAYAAAVWVAAG